MTHAELSFSLAEAIGKTLVHSIWIGFVLLSLLKLLLHAIPHRFASFRYRLAGLTLLIFTGAVASLFHLLFEPAKEIVAGGVTITDGWTGMEGEGASLTGDKPVPLLFWSLISYLYFAGFLWMILRFSLSLVHLQKMKKSGQPPGPEWSERLDKLALRIGIRRKITLLESHRVHTAGIFGWLKPVIIVPGGMLTQMPLDQVETIFMHELYHLKRFDYLVNLLQIAAEALFFYHPAVWMISRHMRVEREHCCDDLVLHAGNPPLLYARALSTLSSGHLFKSGLVTSAQGPGQYSLYNRISRILNGNHMKTDIRERLFTLALLLTGIVVMVFLNGFSSGISILKNQGTDPQVIPIENGSATIPLRIPRSTLPVAGSDTIPLDPETERSQPERADEAEELPEFEEDQEIDVDMDLDMDVDVDVDLDKEVRKVVSEIDWEALKMEIEEAASEAAEEIDWEKIEAEIERVSREVSESIDWEAMKREVEQAQTAAMEEIDWEAMKQEIQHSIDEMDWEGMKQEMKQSMEEIDWDQMRLDMESSIQEIDMEELKQDIARAFEEINWEEIRQDMEQIKVRMDSLMQEEDWDLE